MQRFAGTQAYFARLYAIAQSQYTSTANREMAANLGMAAAVKEKKLGYYDQFMWVMKFHRKEDGATEMKGTSIDQNWEKKTRLEYE